MEELDDIVFFEMLKRNDKPHPEQYDKIVSDAIKSFAVVYSKEERLHTKGFIECNVIQYLDDEFGDNIEGVEVKAHYLDDFYNLTKIYFSVNSKN